MEKQGHLVDIYERRIYPASIYFEKEKILDIKEIKRAPKNFILPGLIDSHIHIESSMATPGSFAMESVSRGTTAVVSDPHEIANVLGIEGVEYMLNDAGKVPLKFWFGAPSCVPATSFESSGGVIDSKIVRELLMRKEIKYLSEMMNFPGVIYDDEEVHRKLKAAKELNKPIDGHAPGLTGKSLEKYIKAGISTDHECSSIKEAIEKINFGMKVLIREGSAARNLDALKDLLVSHNNMVMLCSDDLHPEMLMERHINKVVSRLVNDGFDIFDIIRSCTVNPSNHYDLGAGLLQPGQPADFIVVDDYRNMEVIETWIDGKMVFDSGNLLFDYRGNIPINKFNSSELNTTDILVRQENKRIRFIEAFDGELITKESVRTLPEAQIITSDIESDILKIVVKDRYHNHLPATAFIKGFGLKSGAFASSVAHDSHNIICVGTNDHDIVKSINEVVRMKGGLAVSAGGAVQSLKLPVAGIMSDSPVATTAEKYKFLSNLVKSLGCRLSAPFMTLSFMALLVIPELKLSDNGLFDGREFRYVPLFLD